MYEIQNDKSTLPIIRTSVMENRDKLTSEGVKKVRLSVEYGKIASGLHDKMYCIWKFQHFRVTQYLKWILNFLPYSSSTIQCVKSGVHV